jgi:hypothetical protein
MSQIYRMTQEVRKITELQKSLFNLDEYATGAIEDLGSSAYDWENEDFSQKKSTYISLAKCPVSTYDPIICKIGEQVAPGPTSNDDPSQPPPDVEIREQERIDRTRSSSIELLPNFELLPNLQLLPNLDVLPRSKIGEQQHDDRSPPKKLLPNLEIREQLQTGETVLGYSIVTVKGKKYYLTHSQSNKYYPTAKGWFDFKIKRGIKYLYTRWRNSEGKQKSRCLGRVDPVL